MVLVHTRGLRSAGGESGAIAIIVALLAVTLFGFGALVVDIGNADSVHAQGQSTVDAAALAGVRTLASGGTQDDVSDIVKQYVASNMGITNWAGCTDPAPLPVLADPATVGSCVSTLTSGTPGVTSYQVRVKLPPRHVPSTFGGLFGVSSITISPVAQALSGQPLPPECGPCDPALDESTGQPKPQVPPTGLPVSIRAMLPDPAALPLGAVINGCPSVGVYEGAANDVVVPVGTNCTLKPGLYVFDNANLDVQGNLISYLAPDPADPNPADGAVLGVTLVFYGTGTLTAESGGSITPLLSSLVTPDTTANWVPGDAIPGVSIVIDQIDQAVVFPRRFSLGNDFNITGSVYALDGHATWFTNSGDCTPGVSTCVMKDAMGAQSLIATTTTAFSDPSASGFGRIPTIATDHPMVEPPPSAPHLVK
jgi:Putative Flp pilus-assembly TadE/G-like